MTVLNLKIELSPFCKCKFAILFVQMSPIMVFSITQAAMPLFTAFIRLSAKLQPQPQKPIAS